MAKYYVFHYTKKGRIPKLTPEAGEAVKKVLPDILARASGLKYNGTMCDPATGIGICDWDLPTKAAIQNAMKAPRMPFDTIVPVQPVTI
jgi:hypothetical protein